MDDLDLLVIDALQVAPRAQWSAIGAAIGVHPVTVARRWRRMETAREAWMCAMALLARRAVVALVDVTCRAGSRPAIERAMSRRADVVSIYQCAGGAELIAIVRAATMPGYIELIGALAAIEGVEHATARVVTDVAPAARPMRVHALSPAQLAALRPAPADQAGAPMTAADRDLVLALVREPRRSLVALAAQLHISRRRIHQRVAELQRGGELVLSCGLPLPGPLHSCGALISLAVPDRLGGQAMSALSALDDGISSVQVVARGNLVVFSRLSHHDKLSGFVARVCAAVPGASVVDRRLVIREVKSEGRVLDRRGRPGGELIVDPWVRAAQLPALAR